MNEITLTFNYTGQGEWTVTHPNGFPMVVYFPLDKTLEFLRSELEKIEARCKAKGDEP